MSAFYQMTPDVLSKPDKGQGDKPMFAESANTGRYDHVRRPTRGTQPKEDTFATLEVRTTKGGKNVLLLDSGGAIERAGKAYTPKYSNFLLQSIQESRVEKSQMVETFGPTYIFFFGERPSVYNVSGILLNSADFNWKAEFWENYDKYLRGTQCVTNATRVYLSYDTVVLQGYILSANVDNNAENNELCNFGFQMVISKPINTSSIGDPNFPTISPTAVNEVNQDANQNSEAVIRGNVEKLVNQINAPLNLLNSLGPTAQQESSFEAVYAKIIDNDDEYILRPPRHPNKAQNKPSVAGRVSDAIKGSVALIEVARFATINISGAKKEQDDKKNGPKPLEADVQDKNTDKELTDKKNQRVDDRANRK